MRLLVSGGCKNGKSTLAQRLAVLQGGRRVYIATMRPRDAEDEARILRHRQEREGWGFETVECQTGVGSLAGRFPSGTSLLLDSTTALLAEEMFGQDGGPDTEAVARVTAELLALLRASDNLVIVSDAIYADAITYSETTEAYRRGLAAVDRALAMRSDGVIEALFGRSIIHKGADAVAALVDKANSRFPHGAGAVYGAARGEALGR